MNAQDPSNQSPKDWSWPFWPIVPLYPYGKRRTLRKEVVKDSIWTFDQLQGVLYVVTPIRMTAIKLDAGGLLVYAPVAPTPECIRLVWELVAEHGEVKYIILPTVSGIEHKVFVGPFARCFPEAQVFVAPHQWSFPFNLPLSWLGLPRNRTHVLPAEPSKAPFTDEFDYAMLGPIDLGLGAFEEVVFFHRRSRTLLVTDAVISVPEDPPDIVLLDPYPLLFHAKDDGFDVVEDRTATRRKGWQRIVLFTLYFRPSALAVIPFGQAIRNALNAPERFRKTYFGLFPFKWQKDWKRSFEVLVGDRPLFVAPILQTLILNRAPRETLDWAYQVASWDFQRIIPCHFAAPIEASPYQFQQAFQFLKQKSSGSADGETHQTPCLADYTLLQEIEQELNRRGILPPSQGIEEEK
ncbi:MAG: DUF4336 domain-containing protein [Acaryochloridaceae cyanobacterium RU_4_10]|nr:DUF4336 domain-containing protein [Acaryochloridaceae cyanobacterium RU_4_10]